MGIILLLKIIDKKDFFKKKTIGEILNFGYVSTNSRLNIHFLKIECQNKSAVEASEPKGAEYLYGRIKNTFLKIKLQYEYLGEIQLFMGLLEVAEAIRR